MLGTASSGADQANPVVVFDNVEYDVIAGPDDTTALVQSVRAAVLQSLQIDRLVYCLNRTDDLLYVAACGVAGLLHPPTQQAMSAEVMGLQYKLRAYTGEIGAALLCFAESARNMLLILRGAFKDLYSLHEDDALARLARCEGITTKLAESVGKLEGIFQALVEEAGPVLRLAAETYNLRRKERLPAQRRQIDINARYENIRAKRAELDMQMKKVQTLYEEAQTGQATTDDETPAQTFAGLMTRAVGGGIRGGLAFEMAALKAGSELAAAMAEMRTVSAQKVDEFETRAAERRPSTHDTKKEIDAEAVNKEEDQTRSTSWGIAAENYAKEKSGYLQMLKDLQKLEREALDAMAQDALGMGSETGDEEVEEAAVVSLNHAVVTLKQIVAILAEQKQIWSQEATNCARLVQANLRADVQACMQRPRKERIEAYTQLGFQVHMLAAAAQWHALQLVAMEYRRAVQEAYVKMGQTYQKNPTIGEARSVALAVGTAIAEDVARSNQAT